MHSHTVDFIGTLPRRFPGVKWEKTISEETRKSQGTRTRPMLTSRLNEIPHKMVDVDVRGVERLLEALPPNVRQRLTSTPGAFKEANTTPILRGE